jgi:hypothetical protein
MPFAGDSVAAARAVRALRSLRTAAGDELILADNTGTAPPPPDGVAVVAASGERSAAHARNAGAARAQGEWLLFLDADCVPPADLLDRYFARPVPDDVGALAGEVRAAPGVTVAERYGVARSFLDQRAHLAHPYRPRAVAANLLVRREAFAGLGGFLEGLRAAEDTDFAWRLQDAGWRLALCEAAVVEHRYRAGVGELRRQWRGYAAGRAWLARRYPGFVPEPAVFRLARRGARRGSGSGSGGGGSDGDRYRFLAIDALLAGEELVGLTLSNRPRGASPSARAAVVLVADRFPADGDPRVAHARSLADARVEAVARPEHLDTDAARALRITYREDDGFAARVAALAWLLVRHPLRCLRARRRLPSLLAIAPAVRRVAGSRPHTLVPLGSEDASAIAQLSDVAEVGGNYSG